MKLNLEYIVASPECQARVSLCEITILEYVERVKDGEEAPAITVFYDGMTYWLADGFHRFHSYQRAGKEEIEADVREGTRRDARLFACGANTGLRRTRADKRRAVEILVKDEEWKGWSDREIARKAGVTPTFVGAVRGELSIMDTCNETEPVLEPVRRGKDGKLRRLPQKAGEKSQAKSNIDPIFARESGGASAESAAQNEPPGAAPEARFNIGEEMRVLERFMGEQFTKWPEEKQHAFCVTLRNFTVKHDPEWKYRTLDAIDRHFLPKPGEEA